MVDIFATLAAVVGETRLDPKTTAPDSYNVLRAFTGGAERSASPLRPDLILQSAGGVYAIRSGPWKWVEGVPAAQPGKKKRAAAGPKGDQYKPQLFNLAEDPGETRDVAAQHPEIVKRLSARLREYRERGYSRQ